jgi:hypothetical protein
MAKKTRPQLPSEDKQQVAAFRKAARETGADLVPEYDFQEALRRITKAKPSAHLKAREKSPKT